MRYQARLALPIASCAIGETVCSLAKINIKTLSQIGEMLF